MFRIIATLGGIQVIAVVFNVLRSKLLAVLLGPEGVGTASVVDQAVTLVLQISALSLPFASVRFLSRSHSQGMDAFRRTYSGLISALVILTSLGAILGLAVVFLRPSWLGTELSAYRNMLIPALLSMPAMALHHYMVQVLAAAQQGRTSAFFLLIIAVVQTAGALLGMSLDGLPGYYWATMICNYLLVAGMLFFLNRKFSLPFIKPDADLRNEIRMNPDIVSFTLIFFSISFTMPLSNFLARLAILRNFGETETGLMQAAIALASALTLILSPANGLYLTPMMNRTAPANEKMSAALKFQRMLLLLLPMLAVPMVLFAPVLLILFYSSRFIRVSDVFYLFVFAQYISLLAGVAQAVLIGLSDLIIYAVLVGTSQLSLGLIAWQFAPIWGIHGVALSYLISNTLVLVLCHIRLATRHDWSIPKAHWGLAGYGLSGIVLAGILFNENMVSVNMVILAFGYTFIFTLGLVLLFGRQELRQVLLRLSRIPALSKFSK